MNERSPHSSSSETLPPVEDLHFTQVDEQVRSGNITPSVLGMREGKVVVGRVFLDRSLDDKPDHVCVDLSGDGSDTVWVDKRALSDEGQAELAAVLAADREAVKPVVGEEAAPTTAQTEAEMIAAAAVYLPKDLTTIRREADSLVNAMNRAGRPEMN